MTLNRSLALSFLSLMCSLAFTHRCAFPAETVPFADNGTLKMLYDNRMYPQAVEHNGDVFLVWRGKQGFPYIVRYDLDDRRFSSPFMLLTGMENQVNAKKFAKDHHYAPVVWIDGEGHLHVLFGCHGKAGIHLTSKQVGDMTRWREMPSVSQSISYPKVHRIYGNRTLVYFRHGGHLGWWTYRISSDSGGTWESPKNAVVDLDCGPQDGTLASHAGSYHTTHISRDGRTLHVAFIWKLEEPVFNSRYNRVLGDHTQRYNLYYLQVDLPTGKVFNFDGKELAIPVRKLIADQDCLVWDTRERVAAVGPSICLDENDRPCFLLPVSDDTPHTCQFHFVRRRNDQWERTTITPTPHPFNACHLERSDDGRFKAYLVTGDDENVSEAEMDRYGWGDRIEEWISADGGESWTLSKDLTPMSGWKYQNVKCVRTSRGGIREDMLLFYGWQGTEGCGTAFMWDNRD